MERLQSTDPATGELVGQVSVTPLEAIPGILERARAAQPAWEEIGAVGRAEVIAPVGERIVARAEELGELLTREMGKPLKRAIGEIRANGGRLAEDLEEIVEALAPETFDAGGTASTVYQDPLGVCAAITPWNYPFAMPHWMVLPALVAGNAVVLKPSELTPLIGQAYADLMNEVLPPDVLQVVHGADDQGKALVAGAVDLVAFTGSREVGKKIMAAASGGLKRLVLELGGKDPLLVLGDADLDKAARFAARNSFDNTGQMCVSTERIFVTPDIAEAFVDRLVVATREVRVGPGLDETSDEGPMVDAAQRDHVIRHLEDAVARGAQIAIGGGHDGNFVEPTVVTNVTDDMLLATEETFGPVAAVTVVDDVADAVRAANDSPFGLGAVVFGGDEHRTRAVARRLRAGMIGVNRGVGGVRGTPWVGAKESGYGYHHSKAGHRQFAQPRVVSVPTG